MARDIIVGYDGSQCAGAALEVAVQTARELGDRLVLVFAYEPPGRIGDEFKAYQDALEERGGDLVGEAEMRVRDTGVEVVTELVPERPSEALVNVAKERDARMLVVGTYGESPLRSAFLGSVPHKLLQISDTSVLCVRG